MWFIIKAFVKKRNKQPSNKIGNLVWCNATWIGWVAIFVGGIEEGWLKEWTSHVATKI
jgi:hypothetical protein